MRGAGSGRRRRRRRREQEGEVGTPRLDRSDPKWGPEGHYCHHHCNQHDPWMPSGQVTTRYPCWSALRKRRDSNPRTLSGLSLSRRVHSAALPRFRPAALPPRGGRRSTLTHIDAQSRGPVVAAPRGGRRSSEDAEDGAEA